MHEHGRHVPIGRMLAAGGVIRWLLLLLGRRRFPLQYLVGLDGAFRVDGAGRVFVVVWRRRGVQKGGPVEELISISRVG